MLEFLKLVLKVLHFAEYYSVFCIFNGITTYYIIHKLMTLRLLNTISFVQNNKSFIKQTILIPN